MDIADDLIAPAAACRVLGGNETPLHEATLWRWVKRGLISPPLKIGPQMVRFRKSVLVAERASMITKGRATRLPTPRVKRNERDVLAPPPM